MFPLVMDDIQEWHTTKVLQIIWPQLKRHALILLGEPGRGKKTPIAQIIAMAVARFWSEEMPDDHEKPSYRLTCDLDFLRCAVGSRSCVDIVDDADSNTILIKKLKSLLGVSQLETISNARDQVGHEPAPYLNRQQVRPH